MSIRPIDFQVGVGRAVETTRMANENTNRAEVQHQAFAKELDKQVAQETKQVNRTSESEFNKVTEDGKNRGNAKEQKKKKKDDGKGANNAGTKPLNKNKGGSSMYDVKI